MGQRRQTETMKSNLVEGAAPSAPCSQWAHRPNPGDDAPRSRLVAGAKLRNRGPSLAAAHCGEGSASTT
jgi:hypothetical protein